MPPKKKKGGKKGKGKGKSEKAGGAFTDMTVPKLPDIKTSSLQFAVATSDPVSLNRLVQHYDHEDALNKTDINGSTCLHTAVHKGDFIMVKRILEIGRVDVNVCERPIVGGYAAIHHACLYGEVEILRALLLTAKANLNIKSLSNLGETPLHICCKHNQVECAKLLLEFNANTNIKDAFGHNASFWAVSKGHQSMIALLDLPPPKAASTDEFIKILLEHNKDFKFPSAKAAKGKGDKKGGGKKKK